MSDKGVSERLEDLEVLMTGNGSPEKGVVLRLDRIEQRLRLLYWIGGIVATHLMLSILR